MNTDTFTRSAGQLRVGLVMAILCLAAGQPVAAQSEVGQVTLVAGAPRTMGEAIRPLQAIFSGQQLETGEEDATGLLVEAIVFHVGANSAVTTLDEPGRKRLVLDHGYVVFYTDPQTRSEVVVETPFGRLTARPGSAQESGSGWYTVRHDPAQAGVSPAVSTFAAIEGSAEVEGTSPVAGPHTLHASQTWRIIQGQIPGPPEEGDDRADADALRNSLHRQAAETIRAQTADITRLASADAAGRINVTAYGILAPEYQLLIDSNTAVTDRPTEPALPTIIPETVMEPEPEHEAAPTFAFGQATAFPTAEPGLGVAQYISYAGVPADPDWNDYLTSVSGNPAFTPTYLTRFANGGFSYIQLTGADAQLTANNGERFLATDAADPSGWAMFTPLVAVSDSGFDPDSQLMAVVTDGFQAVAYGEHLAGGGTIGGDGVDQSSGFAVVSGTNIELNADLPAGYPQLDQAGDTTGLTVGGEPVSDQIAALGSGREPTMLHELGPQLLFVSDSNTDAAGNTFNFDGEPIEPTDLNLPGDRQVQADTTGSSSVATPLDANEDNTVGVQFAGQGETVAVIHHTGSRDPDETDVPTSEHFEVVRGERDSVVQWRDGQRVTDADGQLVEVEDLNEDPELRNELFALISEEVNSVVPSDQHTVAGPAVAEPGAGVMRQLWRQPGRLARLNDTFSRRTLALRRPLVSGTTRSVNVRLLKPAGGQLIRSTKVSTNRRHLGRVSPRQ